MRCLGTETVQQLSLVKATERETATALLFVFCLMVLSIMHGISDDYNRYTAVDGNS